MKEEIMIEQENEQQSLSSSLKNIFFKPSRAFENINLKRIIIFSIIIMAAAGFLTGWIGASVLGDTEAALEEVRGMEGMTEEGLAQTEEMLTSGIFTTIISSFLIIGGIIGTIFGWLIMGGILTLVFNLMGGEAKYSKTLAVLGLSWIPLFLREVFKTIWFFSTGEFASATSVLHNQADIFVLWNVILLIVGFSIVYGLSKKKSAAAVLGYKAFYLLLIYGLSSLNQFIAGGFM
ncbi:Yip1 family protein [Candidatus Contubernalis alkaliaceticus]|uniref:Yip1 family protein n=1 Tax=Candidatus Contubernalis alkaliaceticus TaxID=338645 RepID=UPI001F4BDB58|nr:Yip1 family protein [Candidatus Contubernalis alkalaceticus]UNC91965.1 YIP1 family protein [Candidatus Contubernalis alkalaceticus]